MHASISNDFDVAVGKQEIDEYAIVVLGVPHPQLRKDIDRPFSCRHAGQQRLDWKRSLDHEANLPYMGLMTCLNRFLDHA
jgi:hypothetical protein